MGFLPETSKDGRPPCPGCPGSLSPFAEHPDPVPGGGIRSSGAQRGLAELWDEGLESPLGLGAAASSLRLLFTFMSPNIAGRLCVFVPKSK